MRFYVREPNRRKAARSEFLKDCHRIQKGLRPQRVLETDIYITKQCDLTCSYCYFSDYFGRSDDNLAGDPTLEELKLLLDRIDGKTYCLVVLGGEPFCRPDIQDFLSYARSKDIYSIRISTNGLHLRNYKKTLPLIDRLTVSFDSTRRRQYPAQMSQLLIDTAELKKEIGDCFPRLCLSWATDSNDDFQEDVRPLLDYAAKHGFEVKFLPVKKEQKVDWCQHKDIVNQALEYASPNIVTNDAVHTRKLNPDFIFDNCLQGIQYYIDLNGQFLYPCDEFPDQRIGSIYEYDLDELFDIGLQQFGVYPNKDDVCAHCPSGCHSDNSFILQNPDVQLKDLL